MSGGVKIFDSDGVPRGLDINYRDHIVIENTLENSIHVGRRFFNYDWSEIGASGSLNLLLEVAQSSNGDYKLHCDFSFYADQENNLEIFVLPTASDNGDSLSVHNHNGMYQLTNLFKSNLYKDATITNNGSSILRSKLAGDKKISGTRWDSGEFILFEGRDILVKVDNIDTAGFVGWELGFSQIYTGDIL